MNNIFNLIKGEIYRLYKYKILVVGLIVSFIWVLIIALTDSNAVNELIPTLLIMDASLMSIILVTASFYLEKQEGTIKSILVSPVKLSDVLIAKVIASIISNLISAILVVLVSVLIHDVEINYILILLYIIIITATHIAIGLTIALYSKDFGGMLGYYMLYALVGMLPMVLVMIDLIPTDYDLFLIISPTYASQMLVNSAVITGSVDLPMIIISIIYLIVLGIVLYFLVVYKRYKRYAIGG